jgi:hypothetical protein
VKIGLKIGLSGLMIYLSHPKNGKGKSLKNYTEPQFQEAAQNPFSNFTEGIFYFV